MSHPDARPAGLVLAVAVLAWLAVAGATGSEPPQRLAGRFAAAVDSGDVDAVEALLADDPTVITWVPALPRAPNSATMALLDVGRARDMPADRATVADYLGYHRGLDGSTELLGCDTVPPGNRSQERLYDLWVECRFAATNELLTAVTGDGVMRGTARFGLRDGKVRAALLDTQPAAGPDAMWSFMQWIWHEHPDEFDAWLLGPRSGPVISGESAAALRRLAAEYRLASKEPEVT